MRFNAFREAIAESAWFDYSWQDGIRFKIRRSGYPSFTQRTLGENQARWFAMFEKVSKAKGLTLKDMRGGDVDFEKLAEDMPIADLGLAELGMAGLDLEGIALELVEDVDGPLILADDSDDVIPWHQVDEGEGKAAGVTMLEHFPDVAKWILEKAREVQEKYDMMMEASAKNSPSSSAPVAEGAEVSD